jgi:hypothetical protein
MNQSISLDIAVILSLFASALTSVAVIAVIVKTIRKIEAERKLVTELRKISQDDYWHTLISRLFEVPTDATAIHEAQIQIEELAKEKLQESEQKNVLEGLHQPSIRGKVNYMRKLLKKGAQI